MIEPQVFDSTDYSNRLASNEELMALVAAEFIKEAQGLLGILHAHIVNQEWGEFSLVAHRLRGAALEVSGNRFCKLIADMEMLYKQGSVEAISSRYGMLKEEFDALVYALKQHVLH